MSRVETMTLTEHPVTGWRVDPTTGAVYGARGRWVGKRIGRVGSHGYMVTTIRGRAFLHHRVVWEACMGTIPPGLVINHKNGVKTDNRLCNLEVVTSSQNQKHAHDTGLRVSLGVTGPRNWNYRVTPEIKADILRRLELGESGESVARIYGLSGATISRVRRGVR